MDRDRYAREIPAFDLIVVRPVDGIRETVNLPNPRIAYFVLLRRAWERLSPDSGEMYLALRHLKLEAKDQEAWLAALKAANIDAKIVQNRNEILIRLRRHANSADTLPAIPAPN